MPPATAASFIKDRSPAPPGARPANSTISTAVVAGNARRDHFGVFGGGGGEERKRKKKLRRRALNLSPMSENEPCVLAYS